ncbi:MAG: Swt1 family HEPN domain-containing protein [Candidatus Thiocaldithrix dubininis]|uniref:Swt1 family HEPN domain-containing protein n=1 Tax=Candidatus Thiocaldithrix dubininis TaxID=3080823 RepID=A0AA95KH05_9GAMM|nr:MAG: Swt1 family HEPN domain-containing protein [Candidatus Thiocaldithrix dubininis]
MLSKLEKIPDINEEAVVVYAYLQMLEKWLREMVYVELKAKKGNSWFNFHKTKNTYDSDKKYTHMSTPESSPLSYLSFGELQKLIKNNWEIFSPYLPPQNIWDAKLEEIDNIRNRIAHFRSLHEQDLNRVLQFLRDIDQGFWRFCTSYNDSFTVLPADNDSVTNKFADLDPFFPKQIDEKRWVTVGHAPPDLLYIVSIRVIRRLWCDTSDKIEGTPGYLYDLNIVIRGQRQYDYKRFLSASKKLHSKFVHICLDHQSNSIRITIPANYGSEEVINIIEQLIEITEHTIIPSRGIVDIDDTSVKKLADEWPEYVLSPKNPLTFLDSEMPCSFFNA